MKPLHTPAEMRTLSNVGHWIEGGILAIIALLALLEAAALLQGDAAAFAWPAFIFIAGLTLPAYMLLHHGWANLETSWRFVMRDAQQRQHFAMAVLLFLAGCAEVWQRLSGGSAFPFGFVWPGALAIIGSLFLVHTQHGTHDAVSWAVQVHRYLGLVLIAAAAMRLGQLLLDPSWSWLAIGWPVLLLLSAILLVSYREPPGAYEGQPTHGHDTHSGH